MLLDSSVHEDSSKMSCLILCLQFIGLAQVERSFTVSVEKFTGNYTGDLKCH